MQKIESHRLMESPWLWSLWLTYRMAAERLLRFHGPQIELCPNYGEVARG